MYLFTSEVVSPGHPDKVADIIADSIVDEVLTQDPKGRVASEVFVAGKNIIIGGELTTTAKVDYVNTVLKALEKIGYKNTDYFTDEECLKPKNVKIQVLLNEQSPDINQGVDQNSGEIGAGDQGIMFGYADIETKEYMPSAIAHARYLMEDIYDYAKNNPNKYGVDIKTQVTMDYGTKENFENCNPQKIHTVVVSVPSKMELEEIRKDIKNRVLNNPNVPKKLFKDTIFYVNPTGKYVNHSSLHDSGLTGRKLIVDSFGGYAPIGGGAQCVSSDTFVKTIDGYSKISEIGIGTDIFCYNESLDKIEKSKVLEVFENCEEESDDMLEIELETGEKILITENHKIFSKKEKTWKKAKDFKVNDEFISIKNINKA